MFLSACLRYCNQVLNKEIDESTTLLLQELVRFQERVYQRDPSKAKSKRRLVMGLREVTKHMKLLKIKCVIISPNCEKIQAKGLEQPEWGQTSGSRAAVMKGGGPITCNLEPGIMAVTPPFVNRRSG